MNETNFRDRLATVDSRGQRLWVYADVASGAWRSRRRVVAYSLILFYLFLPWLRFNDLPLFQLDFGHGRIIFMGQIFGAHEIGLFLPLIFSIVLLILALTAWAGRVWCGWACPQSVFLEFLYRPIEQFIEGRPGARRILDGKPLSDGDKFARKLFKSLLFVLLSFIIANTFLAFFIGTDRVLTIMSEPPARNLGLFIMMCLVWVGFQFNFGWFREQMCTIACPYGRFQSVLLDRTSVVVGYDYQRGEPRGNGKGGDCVDCNRCVQVCPTGIDIRNGVQMECIHCMACSDACNVIMQKVNRAPNLIGYTSEAKVLREKPVVSYRPWIYLTVSGVMLAVGLFRMNNRNILGVEPLRSGMVKFQVIGDKIENHIQLRIENKGLEEIEVAITSNDADAELIVPQNNIKLPAQAKEQFEIFVKLPERAFIVGKASRDLKIVGSTRGHGTHVIEKKITLFGPER